VVEPLNSSWTCCRCGGSGDLLMMENAGPACLSCAGLEFLPAGDALLTRRAKAKSARYAVVVRFSRSRRRYERQGIAPIIVQQIFASLAELKSTGVTMLLVEQNISVAPDLAERAYVLRTGEISLEGKARDLKKDYEAVAAAYLGARR